MIPFFVGYALIVWWQACRWRRTLRGFVTVAVGVAGLMLVNWAHIQLGEWSRSIDPEGQGFYISVLQAIMYPYTALVGGLGVFIACMPVPERPGNCARCGYELGGLSRPVRTCPECGAHAEPDADGPSYRPSGQPRTNFTGSDVTPRA
ncbi:MAG: hypothetical protein DHS20C14_21420 [Phycisphaeraceae bacterium]|nr:MAG: hypothetical protein DHS20C14_21420 [Phycisphaeraceae bacterium]